MPRTIPFLAALTLMPGAWSQDLSGEAIYERCAGAVVQVKVLDDLDRVKGGGSGVVLKDSAWLITNNHILEGGGLMLAFKDGGRLDLADIVRSDAQADILIVRIEPESFPGTWAKIPDVDLAFFDQLKPGQRVYTIGNPHGLENSISDGLLSARRVDEQITKRMLQISAPISPGSSGGGVFDARGRLIGISTFIYRPGLSQNLNFALAIDDVIEWDRSATRHDISIVPVDPEYREGLERWKEHDCEGAIAHFRKVPGSGPRKGDALYYTARCMHHAGDLEQAKKGYERALEHDPRIARAHAFLAVLLYGGGDLIGALEHQSKAYELDPSLRDAKVAVDDW